MTIQNTILCAVMTALSFLASCVTVQARQSSAPIAGVVIDAESRAPIAGASIVAGSSRTASDAAGRFTLAAPPAGAVLDVAAEGYYSLSLDRSTNGPDADAPLEIALTRTSVVTDALIVRGTAPAAAPATRVVAPVEVLRTPGAIDNVFRALQAQPGVAATVEIGGYLSVRGGAPDQNLTVLDGVEVHDPYRLFGLASAFNPETIDRFELASGGFSAKYGDRLSSLLSIDSRSGDAARRFGGIASLSVTDANVVTEGGFPSGSWLFTSRRTYYDAVANLVSDQRFPGFADVQTKVAWQPRSGASLTVFGLTSRQSGDIHVDGDDVAATMFDATGNDLAWARFEATLGGRVHATTVAGFSDTRVRSGFDASFADDGRRSNAPEDLASPRLAVTYGLQTRIRDWSARQQIDTAIAKHALSAGLEFHELATSLDISFAGDRNPNAANGSSVQAGAGLPPHLVSRLDHARAAAWTEAAWTLADRWSAVTGVRVDRVGLTRETQVSPRLSTTYAPTSAARLRAAVGRYTQSPGYEKLAQSDYLLDLSHATARQLASQQAWIGSVGGEYDLRGGASLRVEAYYKRFADMLIGRLEDDATRQARLARYDFPRELASDVPTASVITSVPSNDGRGRAYGFDVQVSRMTVPAGGRIRGWASYTWGKADREAYGLRFPFEYDRRHSATLVAAYQLSPRWEVATTARVASGFPRTAPIGLRVAGIADVADVDHDGLVNEIAPEHDAAGRYVYTANLGGVENLQRARLPLFARLDARVTWRPLSGRWEVYGEVLNLLNRHNAGQLTPMLEYDATSDRPKIVETASGWIPLLPTVGLRVRF